MGFKEHWLYLVLKPLEAFALHSLGCTNTLALKKNPDSYVHNTMQLVKQLKQQFS